MPVEVRCRLLLDTRAVSLDACIYLCVDVCPVWQGAWLIVAQSQPCPLGCASPARVWGVFRFALVPSAVVALSRRLSSGCFTDAIPLSQYVVAGSNF
jgi:hypothetical protein